MKKIFSLVLAMSFVVGLGAQTLSQYEELLKVKNNNGNAKELNVHLTTTAPIQYVMPEELSGGRDQGDRRMRSYRS